VILLDTHAVLWLAQAPELLSDAAEDAIVSERRRDGVAIAGQSLWELAMLIARKRIKVKTSTRDFLHEVERYMTVLPVTAAIAERSVQFSGRYPKDPTDRLIGATAAVHGLKLITQDRAMRRSGEVECVW